MKQLLALCFCFLSFVCVAQETKLDADKDYVVIISTSYGDMIVLLYDEAPQHKANFIKLAKEGFYDHTTFHRVIDGFMIQGGDANSKDSIPQNDGMGSPGYTIPAEIGLKHKKGALAAARMGDQVNPQRASNGSQFYIVQDNKGATHLDGQYTVFGQVVSGMNVVDKIAGQQTDNRNRPVEDIRMTVKVEEMKRSKIMKKYKAKSFYEKN